MLAGFVNPFFGDHGQRYRRYQPKYSKHEIARVKKREKPDRLEAMAVAKSADLPALGVDKIHLVFGAGNRALDALFYVQNMRLGHLVGPVFYDVSHPQPDDG